MVTLFRKKEVENISGGANNGESGGVDGGEKVGERVGERVGEKVGEKLTSNQQLIIELISENPKISAVKISSKINISTRKVEENIAKLKNMGILVRVGSARGGYWKTIKNE